MCSFAVNLILAGCGRGPWDINDELDRAAMVQETRNALTAANCPAALDMSSQLFDSMYSNNNIRMLYASAQACNIGITLFTLIDDITASDFTSQDAIFKTLVRLFPSKEATDTRLESAKLAQDALQSIMPAGTVVGAVDAINASGFNPGSVRTRDRTDDANIYLAFTSMATVGTALNRYGFAAATDPVSVGYAQQVNLVATWANPTAVKNDTTGDACAIASGLLNMLDGIDVLSDQAPGSVADALSLIVTNLSAVSTAAANAACVGAGFSGTQCADALVRLRYRGSCAELPDAGVSASAFGILQNVIDLGWN